MIKPINEIKEELMSFCSSLRKTNLLWKLPQDEVLNMIEDKIEGVFWVYQNKELIVELKRLQKEQSILDEKSDIIFTNKTNEANDFLIKYNYLDGRIEQLKTILGEDQNENINKL
jgi:hypothetical protein